MTHLTPEERERIAEAVETCRIFYRSPSAPPDPKYLTLEVVPRLLAALDAAERRTKELEEAIAYVRSWYPEDVFLPGSNSSDAKAAAMARRTCDNILKEAGRTPSKGGGEQGKEKG